MADVAGEFSLEVVAHCWNYSRLLAYQISSFILHSPDAYQLTATIFHCPDHDPETAAALAWFASQPLPATVRINPWPLERGKLMRRAIGRNLACLATSARWVWCCDCDYIAGPGFFDAIPAALAGINGPLAFPRRTLRSTTHAQGDAAIERVTAPGIYDIDPADFSPEKNTRAIGGIQFIRGDVAREKGYLNGSRRWMRPERRWRRTAEDVAVRKSLGTRGEAFEAPNLFRIRHSKRGRRDINCNL